MSNVSWIMVDDQGAFQGQPQFGSVVPAGARALSPEQVEQITESSDTLYWPASSDWPLVKLIPPRPVQVPQSISRMQAFFVLASMPGETAGKTALDDANDLVAASGDKMMQIAWREAGDFTRSSAMLNRMAVIRWGADAAQGQLDQLFIAAAAVAP